MPRSIGRITRLLAAAAFAAAPLLLAAPARAIETPPTPSPTRVLGFIRGAFLSHRPPPPYETYTLVRSQKAANGYPDYANSYTYHIWVRTLDDAALGRKIYRDDYEGRLTFLRPAFNEDRDPGPPTADLFQPAPAHPEPVSVVPTPEPTRHLRIIGSVVAYNEPDYRVVSLTTEGDLLHLVLEPKRDPNRNRLRQLWVDKTTYELKRVVATDKLFIQGGPVYPVLFTITVGSLDGYPVVTHIHGVVGGGYDGNGATVNYDFKDITFPKTLPSWYFDPRTYAAHLNDAP